jgi:cardiolipin synthase
VDNRSFALNEELNVALYDSGMAGRLERVFADDLAHSRRLEPEQWRSRGLASRFLEILSIPFREQM